MHHSTYLGRPRTLNAKRRLFLPAFIEFPLIGGWALVWVAVGHIDTRAWYPVPRDGKYSWTGCSNASAHGQVDPNNGLVASNVCNILRTVCSSNL